MLFVDEIFGLEFHAVILLSRITGILQLLQCM